MFVFLITSVWVLSVGPLHWPGRRGLQGGTGSVPVILPCGKERDTSRTEERREPTRRERRCRPAGIPSGADAEARGIFTAVSPQNRAAKRPAVHQNFSFVSTSSDTMGKSRLRGDPREGCSSDSPAKRRSGQTRCLLGLINFSRAEANSRGSSGSRQWPRRQQSRPLGPVASSISNPGVWRGARLQVAFLSFPDTRQGSSWITLPNQ